MDEARPLYAWGPAALTGPGNTAGAHPFERFTTNPLFSAYGSGVDIVRHSIQLQNNQSPVQRNPVVNSIVGNGAVLQGQMWVQSLLDAQALGSRNVSG